jgi:hypothetical protein
LPLSAGNIEQTRLAVENPTKDEGNEGHANALAAFEYSTYAEQHLPTDT